MINFTSNKRLNTFLTFSSSLLFLGFFLVNYATFIKVEVISDLNRFDYPYLNVPFLVKMVALQQVIWIGFEFLYLFIFLFFLFRYYKAFSEITSLGWKKGVADIVANFFLFLTFCYYLFYAIPYDIFYVIPQKLVDHVQYLTFLQLYGKYPGTPLIPDIYNSLFNPSICRAVVFGFSDVPSLMSKLERLEPVLGQVSEFDFDEKHWNYLVLGTADASSILVLDLNYAFEALLKTDLINFLNDLSRIVYKGCLQYLGIPNYRLIIYQQI